MREATLKEITAQLDQANRKLDKEQHSWKVKRGEIQRHNVKLSATNRELERKNKDAEKQLATLQADTVIAEERKEQLTSKNRDLERENHELETSIEVNREDLLKVTDELTTKKANLDNELEEYASVRKQEIKDTILNVNEELVIANTKLVALNSEINSKKTELGELNQVYLDEQEAIKISSAETEAKLELNREKVIETEQKIINLEQELKELDFKKDSALVMLAKTREEHEKFLEYERRARKLLDTKDRQLQEKTADIATRSQFLKNERSFLPPL